MMFGDMGHGSILLCVAIYLVMKGDNEGAGAMRYLLLLMGMFAVYCGLIYNEFFALPINLFQSCYQVDYDDASYLKATGVNVEIPITYNAPRSLWHPSQSAFGYGFTQYPDYGLRAIGGTEVSTTYLGPESKELWQYSPMSIGEGEKGCVYSVGLDYAWGMSSGRLAFANAIKMKMSVIFGIFHMNLGILVKGTNAIFKRNWPIFICEVIGGLCILNFLFGWMDLLVFNKWMHPVSVF
jgi:V-type H+-transporting ATPase subunit a